MVVTSTYFRNLTTPPFTIRTQLSGVSFQNPWADYPGGDPGFIPFGASAPKDIPWQVNSLVTAMDYDTPNMRVGQWNLSIQRQVGTDWLFSANYIGNGTRHLRSEQAINPVFYVPELPSTNRPSYIKTMNVPLSTAKMTCNQ